MRTLNEEHFKRIEDFIESYSEQYGVSPTYDEIADELGVVKSRAYRYVNKMVEDGTLYYSGTRSLKTTRQKKLNTHSLRVPVLGAVSCGMPKFAEENIEEYVSLPASLFGNGEFFILRADGLSMIDVGIDEGDLVLIKQQSTASAGQIVVALVGDEATLKRYYPEPEKRRVRLHPENKSMEDIYVDDCIVQGIAVKVFKDLV